MRRVLFSTISLLALTAMTGSGFAADIPRAAPYRERAVLVPIYNWTGPYLGINGGYAWGNSEWSAFGGRDFDTSGPLIGLTAGYNWQLSGSPWVFGLEGDINWANIKGTNTICAGCETKNTWLGTVRGRLGYAVDRFMPYITGGLAFGEIEANRPGFSGVSNTEVGWTIGAGLEAAIAPNWTAKIEYLYVDLGSTSCSGGGCGLPTNVDFSANILRAGLNFRF